MDRAEALGILGPLPGPASADDIKRAYRKDEQLGGTGLACATVIQSGKPHTRFDTPEEAAAQAYPQHRQTNHPEELGKEQQRAPRQVLLPVQEQLLLRSDTNQTGFKGVHRNSGRYRAECDTPPCHHHNLGTFGTPEEAAQAYLQHREKEHAPAMPI
jgi:hypothetical protein